ETLTRLDQLYTQVYRDNYGVLMAFHRDEVEAPKELQVAAEIALGHRAILAARSLDRETSDFSFTKPQCQSYLSELQAIATESDHLRCSLQLPELKQTLERILLRSLHHCLLDPAGVSWLERLLETSQQLHLPLSLDRAQEAYFHALHRQILPAIAAGNSEARSLLRLGERLSIDVCGWSE
ncbi:MAG: glycoside hydrolase, partial [Microcoleus sp. SIO2G3]|nr:glycoside hydrolase [Microcoleus sp. SIO2G3]